MSIKTKKGSPAWKAKLSKAQKAGWKKRREKEQSQQRKAKERPKRRVYEEVPVEAFGLASEPPSPPPLFEGSTTHRWQSGQPNLSNIPKEDEDIERKALTDWINQSPTSEERAKRKAAMMGILYGGSADSLASSIDRMATDAQPFNPDAMFVKPPLRHDPVNHPAHYLRHPSGVECITITEQFNFNRGNAIKYIWRADEKGSTLENLRKAQWYLNREIERLEKEAIK